MDNQQPTAHEPLFILSIGHSFSSVVCAAIGMHPEALGLPEINLFRFDHVRDLLQYARQGKRGAVTGLKRTVAHLLHAEQTEETVDRATEWILARADLTSAQMYAALIAESNGKLLIDKSPANLSPEAFARMAAGFPGARFLHLHRHPVATSRSNFRSKSESLRGIAKRDLSQRWLRAQEAIQDFGHSLPPGQFMALQGEWFLESPTAVLAQVCDWLGLDSCDGAVAQMLRTEDSPFAVRGPANAPLGNNQGFLNSPKLRIGRPRAEDLFAPMEWMTTAEPYLQPETRNMAHRLGYET